MKLKTKPDTRKIHAADIRKSPRLQKLFRFLYLRSTQPAGHGRPGATGGAIVWKTRIVGLSVAIWELRQPCNGSFKIKCTPEGRTRTGSHKNRFTLDVKFTPEQYSKLGWLFNREPYV